MRPLVITGFAVELGAGKYEANLATRFFASQGITGGCKYYTDLMMRTGSHMGPLAAQGVVPDPFKATFGMSLFEYSQEQHEYGQAFNDFMSVRQSKSSRWFDVYPVQARMEEARATDSDVLLVDVGGGLGHWAQGFRKAMPAQKYPWPLKQIIHDRPDAKATRILTNTAIAMVQGQSTLLIDDYVLSEEKVGLQAACMDIGMMMANGGCERTETQWRRLISAAGLTIVRIWFSGDSSEGSEAVIECQD
ncbi:hypothetical protein diail_9966 [Diaporthe ilicicola]|nr:hypothetical protein diail_9966 [Diaporthe ilicicola]